MLAEVKLHPLAADLMPAFSCDFLASFFFSACSRPRRQLKPVIVNRVEKVCEKSDRSIKTEDEMENHRGKGAIMVHYVFLYRDTLLRNIQFRTAS